MADIVNILLQSFLIILIAYLTVSVLYHLALAVSYLLIQKKAQPPAQARTRFAIVVPAHNEEMLIDNSAKTS